VNFNPPTTITAGKVYIYDVDATDPENQPLTFSLLQGPSGLNILSNNGMLYWIPKIGQVRGEPYKVLIQVFDGALAATTSFAVTVQAPPSVATFVPPQESLVPQEPLAIQIQTSSATTTPTSTVVSTITIVDSGNPLLALITNIADWFRNNYCVLGYLLWLLTILAWLLFLLLGEPEDRGIESVREQSRDLPEEPPDSIEEFGSEPSIVYRGAGGPSEPLTFQNMPRGREQDEIEEV
jgi:hypothetical protein